MTVQIHMGDCREVMAGMDAESIDAIVTDPPYHLTSIVKRFGKPGSAAAKVGATGAYKRHSTGFMGKQWDGGDIAFQPETWRLCFDLLKPGGHMLTFGGSRTFGRMQVAIEAAGFEIRDTICWIFGSGFPKSHNVSKKLADSLPDDALHACGRCDWQIVQDFQADYPSSHGSDDGQFHPATDSAQGGPPSQGDARGRSHAGHNADDRDAQEANTCLDVDSARPAIAGSGRHASRPSKDCPAFDNTQSDRALSKSRGESTAERKRDSRKSDTSRSDDGSAVSSSKPPSEGYENLPQCGVCGKRGIPSGLGTALKPAVEMICLARKPLIGTVAANVQAHGTGALNIDASRIGTDEQWDARELPDAKDGVTWGGALNKQSSESHPDGRWPANVIHDGSDEVLAAFAVSGESTSQRATLTSSPGDIYGGGAGLPSHTGEYGFNDTGTPARFFYTAKADKADRLGSKHPTVKPVDLIAYLCRLITPPGGTVLDPFAGSGTTAMACLREGFDCIVIESEAEYIADIKARLAHVEGADTPLFGIST